MIGTRRTRPGVVLGVVVGVCAVLLVVVLAAVVVRRVGRSQPQPSPSTEDAQVLVTHVELQQRDRSYTVASVVAVVQGDRAFLRVKLLWPDDDAGADAELHQVPVMGATVTHHEPYAGLTAACGQTGSVAPPQVRGPVTLELPCEGLLVPDDVATVELSD
ncbi:MAG TPA: hypothetical protein VGC37_16815 [Friedmanniella sp.]